MQISKLRDFVKAREFPCISRIMIIITLINSARSLIRSVAIVILRWDTIALYQNAIALAAARWQKVGRPRKDSAYQLPMREALLTSGAAFLFAWEPRLSFHGSLSPGTACRMSWRHAAKRDSLFRSSVSRFFPLLHGGGKKTTRSRRRTCNPEDTSGASLRNVAADLVLLSRILGQRATRYRANLFLTENKND